MSGLEGWARERAPELLRRAEAEAVAALRDLLVDAARAEIAPAAQAEPATGRTPTGKASPDLVPAPDEGRPAPSTSAAKAGGHGLWTYCVGRAGELDALSVAGVHADAPVQRIEQGGLVVLASRVPLAEFGEAALHENLNDLPWLERVARAHEAVLEEALPHAPIVPLRLCTIYESEDSLREMLAREQVSLSEALDRLDGRQEWGVKLIVDPEALETAARKANPDVAALEDEVAARSGGGAYMLGRRLERNVAETTSQLASDLAADVHARLSDWARDSVLSPVQNRELSGHEGTMLLNASYLVDAERGTELVSLLAELEEHHRGLGASLELTGPWPPYNFFSRDASEAK